MIEIKHRITGAVLRTVNADTLRDADLRGANLGGADLGGADLCGADLRGSNLRDANLRGANLGGADLTDANLRGDALCGADLRGSNINGEVILKTPLTISNLLWPVFITNDYMRIGCQRHTHAEWASFGAYQIDAMNQNALRFWTEWKAPLLAMCAAHSGSNQVQS